MKSSIAAKAGAVLVFAASILPNWSAAKTNASSAPSATAGVVAATSRGTNDLPVLVKISSETTRILFKGYEGDGRNFYMSFLGGAHVNYVQEVGMEVRDRYSTTGYFVKKFEKKKALVRTTLSATQEVDVSELTLQREGEPPIVLVLARVWEGRDDLAWIACRPADQPRPIRRGQRFTCGDVGYKVFYIGTRLVTIIDQKSGVEQSIFLAAPDN